eukprot:gb/GEZJ01003187.1/.p1 GENE.gb/GEZJ01003187.1/~~gb/GEZJ01003187.1/.p1  ORF type:complete len:139 (-),score=6.57 gb/GEZJ01003187.1/:317-733(-)
MSTYGLVNTIQPSMLTKTTQPDLVKIELNYSAYVERVNDVNAGKPTTQNIKAAAMKQCIKPKLLRSLCILGRIEGTCKSEGASDQAVTSWFASRLSHSERDLHERVEAAVSLVQYTLTPTDPAGSAEQFVLDVIPKLH